MTEPVLKMERVQKRFSTSRGVVTAVDGVTLEIAPGEFVALCGPSGCGKSTLLLLAGALLSPDEGTVAIGEENPYGLNANDRADFRARNIGFVFQQFHLLPFLDVLDNVILSDLARPGDHGATRERALELIDRFNLTHRLHHVPATLSVGEQQRVALARAFLRRPRLLLADEPTGNLDPENAAIILESLSVFAGDNGAVFMVTHDETARSAAGRSMRLEDGRIIS